jgi:hypothetical protein
MNMAMTGDLRNRSEQVDVLTRSAADLEYCEHCNGSVVLRGRFMGLYA